jgi:radical SAM superfamily enzyme YgiQ (UPF0313 family)
MKDRGKQTSLPFVLFKIGNSMLNYIGTVIRPPSEHKSLLLQVTLSCSHNKCTFCPAYKDKQFKIFGEEKILQDILTVKPYSHMFKRVFLCDGDALVIPDKKFLNILKLINMHFPNLSRIGTYANARSVLLKSEKELKQYKENKLGIIYLGIESGDNNLLKQVKKCDTRERMIEACNLIKKAGIKLSVTILLGLAGNNKEAVESHILQTASLLNAIESDFISALTVIPVEGTEFYNKIRQGKLTVPNPFEITKELILLLENTNLKNSVFTANHASNYVPIKIAGEKNKQKTIESLKNIVQTQDNSKIKPEFLRGL